MSGRRGVIRIVVPDFGRYVRSYAEEDGFIERVRPGQATPMLALASVAYGYSHRSIWDTATLTWLLKQAG
jgi:hypothetical protein